MKIREGFGYGRKMLRETECIREIYRRRSEEIVKRGKEQKE